MEYKILTKQYSWDLAKAVQEHIDEGWRPQGGIAINITTMDSYYPSPMISNQEYCQAMVREHVIPIEMYMAEYEKEEKREE